MARDDLMVKYFGNKDYRTIIALDYPGYKYKGRYCYEHHYIWWKNTGHVVRKNKEEIHHINGNKKDNCFENLKLMPKNKHFNYHINPASLIVRLKCPSCGKLFEKPKHRTHLAKSNKSKVTFCSRKCVGRRNQFNPLTQKEVEENVIKVYKKKTYK